MSDNKNSQGESIKREVGERMRKARKSMGLTQEQFGERAGDARIANRLSLYDTGRDHMSMLTFFRISKALGLTPNELSPLELLPEGASVIDEFLDLTAQQQKMIRGLIRMLKEGNQSGK